jgi:phage repressor protein C with HTH and peptisase S24 domain
MNLNERIAHAIAHAKKQRGLTQREIAQQVGVTPGALTQWKVDVQSLKAENLLKLARITGVNAEWLASGRGEMLAADLGPAVETPMRPVVVVDTADDIQHEIFEVPRYTLKASAGNGSPVLDIDTKGTPNYCRGGWAKQNGYRKEDLFSIVAVGDSMEPTIPDGASLIVHRQQQIVNGKVHVICKGNECYVKRLFKQMDGSVLVRSDNQAVYKDVIVQPDDPEVLHVVGLVVSVSFNL